MSPRNDLEKERDFLRQDDLKEWLGGLWQEHWIPLYRTDDRNSRQRLGVYSAMLPVNIKERSLKRPFWDLAIGHGLPGLIERPENGGWRSTYHRFGSADGIEPLVTVRDFYGIHPREIELSEEFRHYFNLSCPNNDGIMVRLFPDGREETVARVTDHEVLVRAREMGEFLFHKGLWLAVYIDSVRFSPEGLGDLGIEPREDLASDDDSIVSLVIRDFEQGVDPQLRSLSRLVGKRLMGGVAVEDEPGEAKEYVEFIVAADELGEVKHSCDPDLLSNNFGLNPGEPHYLTPVFFRPEVLIEYRAQSHKYRVEDGALWCGSLWMLRLDNDNPAFVVAYLGDIGSTLSYSQQLHWLSHNVRPEGGLSDTAIRRGVLAEFADAIAPELRFKGTLDRFREDWFQEHSWHLFKPLRKGDQQLETTIAIPQDRNQKEFDSQVGALSKILQDSIDKRSLLTDLRKGGRQVNKEIGSMSLLDSWLGDRGISDRQSHVTFLRRLQDLRAGHAHRKGEKYDRGYRALRIDALGLANGFRGILDGAISLLEFLGNRFLGWDEPVERS